MSAALMDPSLTRNRGIIYSLCDRSLRAVAPWAAAGWRCIAIDMEPPLRALPGVTHLRMDLLQVPPLPDAAFVMAWPPCTHLALSGAPHWKAKGPELALSAVRLVEACRRLAGSAPLLLENPHGRLAKFWRRPDLVVQPWHFAGYPGAESENYQKATCLWLANGACPPTPRHGLLPVDKMRVLNQPDSKGRATARSLTPLGLAQAIYEGNRLVAGE